MAVTTQFNTDLPNYKNMPKLLTGQTALVTGASRGIGAAIAKRLAEAGALVVVNYKDDAAGATTVVLADAGRFPDSGWVQLGAIVRVEYASQSGNTLP